MEKDVIKSHDIYDGIDDGFFDWFSFTNENCSDTRNNETFGETVTKGDKGSHDDVKMMIFEQAMLNDDDYDSADDKTMESKLSNSSMPELIEINKREDDYEFDWKDDNTTTKITSEMINGPVDELDEENDTKIPELIETLDGERRNEW